MRRQALSSLTVLLAFASGAVSPASAQALESPGNAGVEQMLTRQKNSLDLQNIQRSMSGAGGSRLDRQFARDRLDRLRIENDGLPGEKSRGQRRANDNAAIRQSIEAEKRGTTSVPRRVRHY